MSKISVVSVCLAWLASAAALAQSAPAPEAASPELEAKLEAARTRLEQAAREVAELSMQMTDDAMASVMRITGERRAIIGVQVDPESGKEGARVRGVSPGGPAAEAGVKVGDIIVAVDGQVLAGSADTSRALVAAIRAVKPEQKVKLRILRDGKTQEINVTTRSQPMAFSFSRSGDRPMPMLPPLPPEAFSGAPDSVLEFFVSMRGELAGHEFATLTPKLGAYFGANAGVLVVRAPPDSVYRLEDGDVIQSIDGRVPSSGAHALRILRSYQPGERAQLKLLRQRKTISVDIVVPERAPRRKRAHLSAADAVRS